MTHPISRRHILKTITASLLGASAAYLNHGCTSGQASSESAQDSADSAYAAGGTQAMTGNYPDPFGSDRQPTCILTCAQSLGPCYIESPRRQDITEGKTGLPMRLALQITEAKTCAPIQDATVEVWSTDRDGVYSGQTPASICSNNQPEARQQTFMRGAQTTDHQGRVDFNAIYPGWYPGRTPHLHLKVAVAGSVFIVTQLYFTDALSRKIYTTHPDYIHRPQADTNNRRDGLLRGRDVTPFLLKTQRMPDGVLLASTTIGLRSSTDEPLC